MALYKVTDAQAAKDAPPRLVKARTKAEALHHVTASRFNAETITKVEDAADLMASGIALEIAGGENENATEAGSGDSPKSGGKEGDKATA